MALAEDIQRRAQSLVIKPLELGTKRWRWEMMRIAKRIAEKIADVPGARFDFSLFLI